MQKVWSFVFCPSLVVVVIVIIIIKILVKIQSLTFYMTDKQDASSIFVMISLWDKIFCLCFMDNKTE